MTVSLWVCAVLTVGLATVAFGHVLTSLVFIAARPRGRTFGQHPTGPVTVLVPARNEGQQAIRVLDSILAQDHADAVDAVLLIKDRADTALPHLQQRFPTADFSTDDDIVTLTDDGHRAARVAFTGSDPKHTKINWMAGRVEHGHVAILDCDHQALPDWIRTSMVLLRDEGVRIVQGRRGPLAAGGLFQLWDSLHQHIGCELVQAAFTSADLTVFFTGTTAVMETSLLRAYPLHDCITEDTEFSYRVVLDGERIAVNPWSGSDEEVSPNLYSFLARRRRWANGHTSAFLRHVGKLGRAPLRLRDKLQFLAHGVHYLLSVPVFVLHLLLGLMLLGRLPTPALVAAIASSLLLGGLLLRSQRTTGWIRWMSEVAVVFGWVFPAAVIVMNAAVALLLGDLSLAALPLPPWMQAVGLFGFLTPLFVLLVGLAGFRQLSIGTALTVILTWPVAFYLDLSGVLIGIVDCLFGRQLWHAVARSAPAPQEDPGVAPTFPAPLHIKESWRLGALLTHTRAASGGFVPLLKRPSRWLPWVALFGLFAVGVLYTPVARIPVETAPCEVMQHDTDPWIVPVAKMTNYCGPTETPQYSTRSGTYSVLRSDPLDTLDPSYWDSMDSTFFCNEARFLPRNVIRGDGMVYLHVQPEQVEDRAYTAANIATKDVPEAKFLYGRFEAEMKPARGSGLLTAFFLYRFDPWQEIDVEFLGRDTTKMLINVYYNPGEEGDLYNYGFRGTPVLIDLGFDAADAFHRYAIEWDADEIRWFVDDRLIHRRRAGRPTPIPHLPMRIHANVWPTCSEELAGPLDPDALPTGAEFASFTFSEWKPAPSRGFAQRISAWFGGDGGGDWRDDAGWIQPGRAAE